MAAIFSQQFTVNPGGFAFWTIGASIQVARAGIRVFSEAGAYYRYRGALATFVTVSGAGNQIFPEHFIGACWYPQTALILPRTIFMGSLVFRCSRQVPGAITFAFFVDDALN